MVNFINSVMKTIENQFWAFRGFHKINTKVVGTYY